MAFKNILFYSFYKQSTVLLPSPARSPSQLLPTHTYPLLRKGRPPKGGHQILANSVQGGSSTLSHIKTEQGIQPYGMGFKMPAHTLGIDPGHNRREATVIKLLIKLIKQL